MPAPLHSPSSRFAAAPFGTTQWSMVLAAGGGATPQTRAALDQLCTIYWPPLYGWLRRNGCSSHDAADVLQSFFARLLEKHDLASVDPARGRFRSFLLAALKNFLANHRKHERAAKRGGGRQRVSLDVAFAESLCTIGTSANESSDTLFDRDWAITLLAQVRATLAAQQAAAGKAQRFAVLEPYLSQSGTATYAEAARELDLSENAVKVAVHRLRQQFKELLRAAIGQTVESPAEIDAEIRQLFEALRH